MENKYKYEVAFSFLAKDEILAYELNDLITDRVSTFIYSKRQEELGGTDGELSFNQIFSEDARIVVVLYRDGWGSTPWTRIEETAIRNRAYNEGWNFVIYILLDKDSNVPKYLPKAQLWIDYERWGLKGVAPIIEQRIKDTGGEVIQETVQGRMARLRRAKIAEQKRQEYLRSREAYDDSHKEFQIIFNQLKAIKSDLEDKESGIYFDTQENQAYFYEFGFQKMFLLFKLNASMNINHGVDTKLTILIYQKEGQEYINYKEIEYFKLEYNFDRSLTETIGWSQGKKQFFTSTQLIDFWVKKFIDQIEVKKIKSP